jgi:hypothetical protein
MVWNKNDHPIAKWASFGVDHLPQIGDVELATLKMHLVVEDALRYLLAARLGLAENSLLDHRIDFAVLQELALAGMDNPHLLGAMRALNAARNHLSHVVASSKTEENLVVFVREISYMKKKNVQWPSSISEQLETLTDAFNEATISVFDMAVAAEEQHKAGKPK